MRSVAWVVGLALAGGCATAPVRPASLVRVSNHHELGYAGPVEARLRLPDGTYAGAGGVGEVRAGRARLLTTLPADSSATLKWIGPLRSDVFGGGALSFRWLPAGLSLAWQHRPLGTLQLGLVVLAGDTADAASAERAFRPLAMRWKAAPGGELMGAADHDGYHIEVTLEPYAAGWVDAHARLTRTAPTGGPAYVALVRRVTTPGLKPGRQQLNGRVLDGVTTPDTWSMDFRYAHGSDWVSWRAGAVSLLALSGFSPVPTIRRRNGSWAEGSYYYVREESRRRGDALFFFSEVAGPNPHQPKRGAMAITPYAPVRQGDTVAVKWRLAAAVNPPASWPESQWRVFAGYRGAVVAATAGDSAAASAADPLPARPAVAATVDLGVPAVTFGTAYFPYSTFNENFDFYRTPGLDQETYWPFSAAMWKQWRLFEPRMRTDLHILRAMGFGLVRLHHLELLQQMDRTDALGFLDFYMGEARRLGLKVMIDTEGPPDWVTLLARRYGDVVTRFELENEIVIQGVKPGSAARWTALYHAAKSADPAADVFFTGAGNDGQFERMRELGVPFDRVGLHAYKHGPDWEEAYASHALGTAGYAADHGQAVTLGEFNWKNLTRLSPEARSAEVARIYAQLLRPRAIPEVVEFHLQETLSVNPSIARKGIRHYEPLSLDRRPKPEGLALMRDIRAYSAADAPIRELPIEIEDTVLRGGSSIVPFRITNATARPLALRLSAEAFDGLRTRLASPDTVTLQPGAVEEGRLELTLPAGAAPGTYHHFLKVDYDGKTAWGWGIAANEGAPTFSAPLLAERVLYPQGADVVGRLDFTRPLAVAFGSRAPVLELEMAYLVANTLQAATGRPVYLSSIADLPAPYRDGALLVLVGTPQTNSLVPEVGQAAAAGKGMVVLRNEGGQRLLLTGSSKQAVEAAATDFVLRYWRNAKDAAIRLVGMERGAALGQRAGVGATDLP